MARIEKKPKTEDSKFRVTEIVAEARVRDFIEARLAGAEIWDLRDFVRSKEKEPGSNWFLVEGQEPLSNSQILRYKQRADEEIRKQAEPKKESLFADHLARRRYLYGKATQSGDLRCALSALQDEANLLGMYPPKQTQLTGAKGDPLVIGFIETPALPAPPLLLDASEPEVPDAGAAAG